MLQHISGLQFVSTNAMRTAGWVIGQKISLLAGRAVAVLINDRCAPFYLVSVYLHPDSVHCELEQIINAWRNIEKKSDKIVIGGILTKQIQDVLSFGKSSSPCLLLLMYTLRLPPTYSLEARLHLIVVWFGGVDQHSQVES